jgi:WD40 repeat protein
MGGWDHTFRVWDAAEGRPLTPLARHARRLEHIAFSPDGESFATASLDGTARVWDTVTGQPLTPWLRHPIAMMGAFFRPDGREVVTCGAAGIVRLWRLAAPEERSVDELVRMSRLYSARRIEPGAGSVPLTGRELERLFLELRADAPL